MNILSFSDVENYLRNQQVYFRKEIVDSDMKTIAKANRVYDIGDVEIERINKEVIVFFFVIDGIERRIYAYRTNLGFFAWIKVNFIPVSELIKSYDSN